MIISLGCLLSWKQVESNRRIIVLINLDYLDGNDATFRIFIVKFFSACQNTYLIFF